MRAQTVTSVFALVFLMAINLFAVDFHYGVAAGLDIKLDTTRLFVDGRYVMGQQDMIAGGDVQFRSGDEVIEGSVQYGSGIYTRDIQVTVGVVIPFSK